MKMTKFSSCNIYWFNLFGLLEVPGFCKEKNYRLLHLSHQSCFLHQSCRITPENTWSDYDLPNIWFFLFQYILWCICDWKKLDHKGTWKNNLDKMPGLTSWNEKNFQCHNLQHPNFTAMLLQHFIRSSSFECNRHS